jgi:hypothetical protein
MRREQGGVRRANAKFSAATKQYVKQICKRLFNFKFESVPSARSHRKIGGVVDFLEIENGSRQDFWRECFSAKQPVEALMRLGSWDYLAREFTNGQNLTSSSHLRLKALQRTNQNKRGAINLRWRP